MCETAAASCHRHDVSDRAWNILAPMLPGGPGKVDRPVQDNRRFINAVFRVLRTGAPWRDLPPDFGHWNTACIRCHRWRQKGVWAQLLEAVIDEPDLEWLMIDASYVKAHQHSASAVDGNQAVGRTKGAPIPNAFGGRCPRDAGQFAGHGGNGGGLYPGGGAFAGGSGL